MQLLEHHVPDVYRYSVLLLELAGTNLASQDPKINSAFPCTSFKILPFRMMLSWILRLAKQKTPQVPLMDKYH